MSELTCDDVLMAWMAEGDGEESTLSGEQISAHIQHCENCEREIEGMLRVNALLQRQARQPHEVNLWPAVEQHVSSHGVPQTGWRPFGLLAAIFVGYKLLEMLPEQAPGIAFKLVPLIFIVGLFVVIKENPFRINAELTPER